MTGLREIPCPSCAGESPAIEHCAECHGDGFVMEPNLPPPQPADLARYVAGVTLCELCGAETTAAHGLCPACDRRDQAAYRDEGIWT